MEQTVQEKVIFYYIRDYQKRPVITVCLIRFNGIWSRGVAICSDKDQPVKKEGRMKAFGRAQKATCNQNTVDPVRTPKSSLPMLPHWDLCKFAFKSDYDTNLMPFEQRLVDKCCDREEVQP